MEYGFLSVLPPVLTIVLAVVSKNVFVSLFIGVFLGQMIISGWHLAAALDSTLYGFINTFQSSSNTITIASILLIGAIIYIIECSGGIEGFVEIIVKKRGIIGSKRAANIFTWLLGVVVFTSGSLSCMVVGSVSRPVNDALKVPHEKAAFLVHTTSTPVCVLLPLSGWGASLIGYLTSGGVPEETATAVMVQTIGLNFYCIIAVAAALILAICQKDFGPMKKAEERAASTGLLDEPGSGIGSELQKRCGERREAESHKSSSPHWRADRHHRDRAVRVGRREPAGGRGNEGSSLGRFHLPYHHLDSLPLRGALHPQSAGGCDVQGGRRNALHRHDPGLRLHHGNRGG